MDKPSLWTMQAFISLRVLDNSILASLLIEFSKCVNRKLISYNGSEFTSQALDAWAYEHGVKLQFVEPGKPVQNAYVKSFNGKLRDERLNEHWFKNVYEARNLVEEFCTVR